MQDEIFDIDLYNDEFFEWHLKYNREYSIVNLLIFKHVDI